MVTAAMGNGDHLAAIAGNNICCKDVVINSGRRRSSGARSLISLPPGMVDSDAEEDMLMDEMNWDKLL